MQGQKGQRDTGVAGVQDSKCRVGAQGQRRAGREGREGGRGGEARQGTNTNCAAQPAGCVWARVPPGRLQQRWRQQRLLRLQRQAACAGGRHSRLLVRCLWRRRRVGSCCCCGGGGRCGGRGAPRADVKQDVGVLGVDLRWNRTTQCGVRSRRRARQAAAVRCAPPAQQQGRAQRQRRQLRLARQRAQQQERAWEGEARATCSSLKLYHSSPPPGCGTRHMAV